jgi:hypothetical protein
MSPNLHTSTQKLLECIDATVERQTLDRVIVSIMAARKHTPGLTLAAVRSGLRSASIYTFHNDKALDEFHRRALARLQSTE